MTIWCIRYADRNNVERAIFREQKDKPDETEAVSILREQIRALEGSNTQYFRGHASLSGLRVLGITEVP